jgi:membrane protein involved in colicin uptake
VLGNEEKWKNRGRVDVPTFLAQQATAAATIIDDDDSSGDDRKRSSTPHSVTKRPVLGRKAAKELKGKKAGDDDIAKAMEKMAKARVEYNVDKKEAEVRRMAMEQRLAAAEERKMAMDEKKMANEEHQRLLDEERKLFFMDTSNMDERQKEYIHLARDEVLKKK